jgi:hypothetical protein
MSFDCRIETIDIQSYYRKVHNNYSHLGSVFGSVLFFANSYLFIYSSNESHSFLYFHGCVYVPLLRIELL